MGRDFNIYLGPYPIRVKYIPDLKDDGGELVDGLWESEKETYGCISIHAGQPPLKQFETLLHEVIEAIDHLYDLGLSHQSITTIGIGLAQTLQSVTVLPQEE